MCSSPFLNKFRSSLSQIFFKLVVLKNFANLTGKHLFWSLFLIKLQVLRTTTLLKGDYCEIWEIFRNILFLRTSPVAASDSFRFPTCNFNKKEILAEIFFFEFCKILKNIFWQNTSGWLLLKFRSSRQVFCKKDILKNFAKFVGKNMCQSLFLTKLQTWGLQLY